MTFFSTLTPTTVTQFAKKEKIQQWKMLRTKITSCCVQLDFNSVRKVTPSKTRDDIGSCSGNDSVAHNLPVIKSVTILVVSHLSISLSNPTHLGSQKKVWDLQLPPSDLHRALTASQLRNKCSEGGFCPVFVCIPRRIWNSWWGGYVQIQNGWLLLLQGGIHGAFWWLSWSW